MPEGQASNLGRNTEVKLVVLVHSPSDRVWERTSQNTTASFHVLANSLLTVIISGKYSHAPHTDVSVNDGPFIRRCSHKIIIL